MLKKENNFAYIDGANLYRGVESLGWNMDYRRFRVWLAEKYGVKSAYLSKGQVFLLPIWMIKKVFYKFKKKPPIRTKPYKGLFRKY